MKEPLLKVTNEEEKDLDFLIELLKESTTASNPKLFPEGNNRVTWEVYKSIMNIYACFTAIDTDSDKVLNKEQLRLLLWVYEE